MRFDLVIIRGSDPLSLPPPGQPLFPMKVRSLKVKDDVLPSQGQLLGFPRALKVLDLNCKWMDERVLYGLLREEVINMQDFSLKIRKGLNNQGGEGSLANNGYLDLNKIQSLQSLTLKSWIIDPTSGANQVFLEFLTVTFPALSSFSIGIPVDLIHDDPDPTYDRDVLLDRVFKFVARHGQTSLRKLRLNLMTKRAPEPIEVGREVMEELRKVNHLTHLTIEDTDTFGNDRDQLDAHLPSPSKEPIVCLIQQQRGLTRFNDKAGILDFDLLTQVIRNNSRSLKSLEAHEISPTTSNEENNMNMNVLDFNSLRPCTLLKKLVLSTKRLPPGGPLGQMKNLQLCPLGIKILVVHRLRFMEEGNQLGLFSQVPRPRLTQMNLCLQGPSRVSDLAQIMVNLLHNLTSIEFLFLWVDRMESLDQDVVQLMDPESRAEVMRIMEFFKGFSNCEIEHYYKDLSRVGLENLGVAEVEERLELYEITELMECLVVRVREISPEDRALVLQAWTHPFEPSGTPLSFSRIIIDGSPDALL